MKKLLLLVLIVSISGCATPYQSSGFRGGFKDTRLDDNSFMIDFKGNGFTSKERAYDFSLLRSAEITLENGYKYFIVMSENEYSSEYKTQSYSSTDTKVSVYGNTARAKSKTTDYGGYTVSKPSAKKIIVCFKEKPKEYPLVYNAKYIMEDICEEYGIENKSKSFMNDGLYVGASTSNIFHKKSCKFAKNIPTENLIFFETKEDAQKQGYRPCKVCKP